MAGSALVGNLAVNLSMETASFQRSATIAEKRATALKTKMGGIAKDFASGFGIALGATAITAGIVSVVSSAFDMASSLSEASEKLGLTVEGLQRLRLAADQTGVSNDQLDAAMTRLNKSLGALQMGSQSATASFAKIGLSADDLKGKKPDEALRIIADALNKLPDAQQRVAVGSEIMGKGFAQLLPLINGGSKALDAYAQQSQKNGEISTEDAQKLDDLADSWGRFKTQVSIAAATIIASSIPAFQKINGFFVGMNNAVASARQTFIDLANGAVNSVNNMVSGIATAITGRLSAIWEGAKAKIESVKTAFFKMYDAVVGHSYVPDMVDGIASSMSRLQEVLVDPTISATDKVGAVFETLGQTIGSIFGNKVGGILSSIGKLAQALGPLFGQNTTAALPSFSGGSTGSYPLPGFAKGGSGVFGGRSGMDRNVISMNGSPMMRVSKGEHFSVSPDGPTGQRIIVQPSPYFNVVVDKRASNVAAPMAGQAAVMGASGAEARSFRRAQRRIA